jgi:hypothetical protein
MSITKELVSAALDDGVIVPDGHTIYRPDFYSKHFSEDTLNEAGLVQTLESDFSSHKSTIFSDGAPVESITGVYNLSFLYWLKDKLGITEPVRASGRGFQAQEIVRAIEKTVR